MRAALLLLACTTAAPPPSTDPVVVGDQVAMRLTQAALLRQRGEVDDAVGAWTQAHDRFEAVLEPELRTRCGDRCATELEYGFARVRSALDTDAADANVIADDLGVRIQRAVAALPPPEDP